MSINDLQDIDILPGLFLFCIAVCIFVFILSSRMRKEKAMNDSCAIVTVKARVVETGQFKGEMFSVLFDIDNSERKRFYYSIKSIDKYEKVRSLSNLSIGDEGILTYQGNRFISFKFISDSTKP